MSATRRRRFFGGRSKVVDGASGMMVLEPNEEPASGGGGSGKHDTAAADLERDVESLYGWIKYVSPLVAQDRRKSMMQIVAEQESVATGAKTPMALCEEYTSDLPKLAAVVQDWQIPVTAHLFRLCMADPTAVANVRGLVPARLVALADAFGDAQINPDSSADTRMMPDEWAMMTALTKVLGDTDDYDAWVVRAHATLYLNGLRRGR
jgi:hypothetical protein